MDFGAKKGIYPQRMKNQQKSETAIVCFTALGTGGTETGRRDAKEQK